MRIIKARETMRPAENTEKMPQKLLWINYFKRR